MRRLSQKVLRILDGSPGALGGYQRGQSLVELLLVTPLLIIMVAGIIEIGWYANHVLILLEVTRVGARQATLLTGEYGYTAWDNQASIHPIAYTLNTGFVTAKPGVPDYAGIVGPVFVPKGTTPPVPAANYRDCNALNANRGFYNSIVCGMLNSLDPLTIKGRTPTTADIIARRIRVDYDTSPVLYGASSPGGPFTYKYNELFLYPDDIVISVFSLQAINNTTTAKKDLLKSDPNTYSRTYDFGSRFPRGYQVVVVGRYPTNANECNVVFTPNPAPSPTSSDTQLGVGESVLKRILTVGAMDYDYGQRSVDPGSANMNFPSLPTGTYTQGNYDINDKSTWMFRDPFDYYIMNGVRDGDGTGSRYYELAGYDTGAEMQRGFTYTGQNLVDDILDPVTGKQLFCIGSDWSDQRVQDLMNSPNFLQKGVIMPPDGDPDSAASAAWNTPGNRAAYDQWQERAKFLPSQGMVLVEMYWRHDILLNFPLMRPIIRLMEGAGGPYNIVISVWAAFPLPSAEPNLNYGFPN